MIQSGALRIERRLLRFGFCRVERIFYGIKLRLRFVECGAKPAVSCAFFSVKSRVRHQFVCGRPLRRQEPASYCSFAGCEFGIFFSVELFVFLQLRVTGVDSRLALRKGIL